MNTKCGPWELAGDLLYRSTCRVKMAAVIVDQQSRVFAWGWNHCGVSGLGMCAERHAIQRANPSRLRGSTIHVRGWNGVNESVSLPCRKCYRQLVKAGVERIECMNNFKFQITVPLSSLDLENLIVLKGRGNSPEDLTSILRGKEQS